MRSHTGLYAAHMLSGLLSQRHNAAKSLDVYITLQPARRGQHQHANYMQAHLRQTVKPAS